jgi:DNA-directed RNA polymerase specialized sigma24 family protein
MGHRTDGPRSITAAGLARLLTRLHPDADEAGLEYERLRRALVRFFDWRGAMAPEDCADEAIDRLARKLEEIVVDDVRGYAHGIARLVLLERRRAPVFSSIEDQSAVTRAIVAPLSNEDNLVHDCFERCLAALPEDGRSLVLRYYEGEGLAKAVHRRQLAATLGLSENALRSRIQRVRDRLERCLEECVSGRK